MDWDKAQEPFIQVQKDLETIWIQAGEFVYPSGETLVIKEMENKGDDLNGIQKN